MAIRNMAELGDLLQRDQRVLALDLGSKTIGLALSDVSRAIASPYDGLKRGKFTATAEALAAIIEKEGVGAVVIGLPLNMDGSAGPAAQSARDFALNLTDKIDVPVALWDERLSTVAVERTMLEADMSRKRRGEVVDKLAATFILQGALDHLAALCRPS